VCAAIRTFSCWKTSKYAQRVRKHWNMARRQIQLGRFENRSNINQLGGAPSLRNALLMNHFFLSCPGRSLALALS
jgi:hypothetical protein